MANLNNVNGQSMVNSKEVRDSQLAALENKLQDLRESHIWESTGGKFETVFRDYMTTKQVVEFFGVADRKNISVYLNKDLHGNVNEKRDELIEAGVLVGKSHAEIMEMRENFMTIVDSHENSIPNDVSSTYKFHSGGETLWSLKAVVKLGMFMDRTDSAKLFRDAIIEMLSAQVTVAKAYQSTVQGYLQQMELSAQQGNIFETSILTNIMSDLRATSKVCYKQDILNTIDTLSDVTVTYNKLLMQTNMFEDQLYYSQIKSALEQLTISINVLQQTIIKLDGVRLDANTAKELYNRSDIIKDAVLQKRNESSTEYNVRISQLTSLLEIAGYVSIETDYQAPQRDASGKKIFLDPSKCDSKTNTFIDIHGNYHLGTPSLKYVGKDEDKRWIFNNEYVMNRDTKKQVLKYTPVGRSLWGALYRQADVVYDKIVAKFTDSKGNLNIAKLKKAIDQGKSNESLIRLCKREINLTKEEFEAQYAYSVLNNKTNTIILL